MVVFVEFCWQTNHQTDKGENITSSVEVNTMVRIENMQLLFLDYSRTCNMCKM